MSKIEREAVAKMSGPELVSAFNALTGGKAKRFASREEGVKRVLAALDKQPAPVPATPPAATAPAKAAPKPRKAPAPQPAPVAAPAPATPPAAPERPAAEPAKPAPRTYAAAPGGKLPRPASKRGLLLAALREPAGLTAAEICERFAWKANDAKDALYLLAKKNGVAVACGEDGRWHAQ